jgi:hypothetical protein
MDYTASSHILHGYQLLGDEDPIGNPQMTSPQGVYHHLTPTKRKRSKHAEETISHKRTIDETQQAAPS